MVQEKNGPDVEDETIAKDKVHESSNKTIDNSIVDMPNDAVNKIGLSEPSTGDQKSRAEVFENIDAKSEEDNIFDEIDRMQKMIQQEKEGGFIYKSIEKWNGPFVTNSQTYDNCIVSRAMYRPKIIESHYFGFVVAFKFHKSA